LFGTIDPGEGEEAEYEDVQASRMSISHALGLVPKAKTPRIRDSVGIDRISRTSASAGSVKFDVEVLPPGTTFELQLELEDTNEQDEVLL
jgi:hypothetical protein